jgi:phosphoglycerol transferase MdoB-like AlkP superfamily enzyme
MLWLIALYSFSRIFFYILNINYFSDVQFQHIIRAFLLGIRFDLAAIVFTNAIFILLLLPGKYKDKIWVQKTGNVLFFAINAFVLATNFIDAKFFDFINKRSTSSLFTLLGTNRDVWFMLPRFLLDYWYVVLIYGVVLFLFFKNMPRLKAISESAERLPQLNLVKQTGIFILLFGLLLLGARGTKLKPIGIADAAAFGNSFTVPLILNTPFSIIKTMENENLHSLRYMAEDSIIRYFSPLHEPRGHSPFIKRNVVIIILESFSKEYSGFLNDHKGYTPHLDSILEISEVYPNAFSNGTQSYEALPAILSGMPSWMDRPYSGSNYAMNTLESLPSLLRSEGYHTSFFHGGNNGTMGFDNFSRLAGVDRYFGRNEYDHSDDYDGHWGIWDEPFLQFFADKLNTFPEPFFSAVFTLSSHHPYQIPAKYKDQFKGADLPIIRTIQYADYALGRFFAHVKNMPWYHNTLFVITADHAAQAFEAEYNSSTGMYAIPLAFFCPSDSGMRGADYTVAQQIDIMPTLLNLLQYPAPYFAFGSDLNDSLAMHCAITYKNGQYQIIADSCVLLFNGDVVNAAQPFKQIEDHSYALKSQVNDANASALETHLKAVLQTYHRCLIGNTTTYKNFRYDLKKNK